MAIQLTRWETVGNFSVRRLAKWHTSSWWVGGKFVHDVTNMANLTPEDLCKKWKILNCRFCLCRSQWPRGLRRTSTAARPLRLWVRIPPAAWMSVYCECCVLSGRGLCDELITLPEKSYRLRCVVVCDLETSRMRRPWPAGGLWRHRGGRGRFCLKLKILKL